MRHPSLEELCNRDWTSGSFRVKDDGRAVRLRKSYLGWWLLFFPIVVVLFELTFSPAGIVGTVLAAIVFVYAQPRPPVLAFNRLDGELEIPALGVRFAEARLGLMELKLMRGEIWKESGEALFVEIEDAGEPVPILVEKQAGVLRKPIERFAKKARLDTLDLPETDVQLR